MEPFSILYVPQEPPEINRGNTAGRPMQIHVLYTAQLKDAAGAAEQMIILPDRSTVRRCLSEIVQIHGEALRTMLFDSEENLLPSVLLCLGDEQISIDHASPLSDGDELTLLSAISGG
ncbi:MAG: MoaD/ThiS family protein [Pirellulales bacterium]|jgi:molybdopterin converting factor small subunit|nr:MoaD/ThiS family protein [Pirellulales bacterium]|tara:strand:- start:495 stop:848 length:354 start_codon:yes stop_codon:yes gene_type:complete